MTKSYPVFLKSVYKQLNQTYVKIIKQTLKHQSVPLNTQLSEWWWELEESHCFNITIRASTWVTENSARKYENCEKMDTRNLALTKVKLLMENDTKS